MKTLEELTRWSRPPTTISEHVENTLHQLQHHTETFTLCGPINTDTDRTQKYEPIGWTKHAMGGTNQYTIGNLTMTAYLS